MTINSCAIHKKVSWDCIQFDKGNLAFCEMFELIGASPIDNNEIKAVKIYSYNVKKNGKIKDSTLIEYQNLDYFSTLKDHTIYEIKKDSLGRDFERYATRIETGETHLNYRKTYNENSKLLELTVFNVNGKINSKTFYYYDKENRLVKEEEYYGLFLYKQPKLKELTVYEYQDSLLIRTIQWDNFLNNEGFDSKLQQEYNSKNQLTDYRSESIENDSITSFWGFKSFYDNYGKLETKILYGSEDRNIVTHYKYNKYGFPFEIYSWEIKTKHPTRLIRYFYEGQRKDTENSNLPKARQ